MGTQCGLAVRLWFSSKLVFLTLKRIISSLLSFSFPSPPPSNRAHGWEFRTHQTWTVPPPDHQILKCGDCTPSCHKQGFQSPATHPSAALLVTLPPSFIHLPLFVLPSWQICPSRSHLKNTPPLIPNLSSLGLISLLLFVSKLLESTIDILRLHILISHFLFNPLSIRGAGCFLFPPPPPPQKGHQWLPGAKSNGNTPARRLLHYSSAFSVVEPCSPPQNTFFFKIFDKMFLWFLFPLSSQPHWLGFHSKFQALPGYFPLLRPSLSFLSLLYVIDFLRLNVGMMILRILTSMPPAQCPSELQSPVSRLIVYPWRLRHFTLGTSWMSSSFMWAALWVHSADCLLVLPSQTAHKDPESPQDRNAVSCVGFYLSLPFDLASPNCLPH